MLNIQALTDDELDVTFLRNTQPAETEAALNILEDACRSGTLDAYETVTHGLDAETLKWMRRLHTPDWVRRINRDYASGQLSYAEFLAGFELCATLHHWKGVQA